jgi:hypothetical protein
MSISIVKNENEIYHDYKQYLIKRSKVVISIHNVSDAHKDQICRAVQELVMAEVIRLANNQLRAVGVNDEFLDERRLRTSLEELPLPPSDRKILEARTRQMATYIYMNQPQENGGSGESGRDGTGKPIPTPRPYGTVFVQGVDGVCYKIATGVPGTEQSLSAVNPLPAPRPGQVNLWIKVGLHHKINFWDNQDTTTDSLILMVEPGGPYGIGPNEMLIGLGTGAVNSDKEIVAWNLVQGKVASISRAPNMQPIYMQIYNGCTGTDTIIFRAPGFLGIWYDIANFDYALFWSVFGGKRLTFTWMRDDLAIVG